MLGNSDVEIPRRPLVIGRYRTGGYEREFHDHGNYVGAALRARRQVNKKLNKYDLLNVTF